MPGGWIARVGKAEIGEHIAGAANDVIVLGLFAHLKLSRRRLIRARIKSVSRCGVLIPRTDFFCRWLIQKTKKSKTETACYRAHAPLYTALPHFEWRP
jgi:hypothetical protein